MQHDLTIPELFFCPHPISGVHSSTYATQSCAALALGYLPKPHSGVCFKINH
jgi:hypothetical protein